MVDQKNVLTKCILLLEKCPWNGTWVKPFHSGNVHRDIKSVSNHKDLRKIDQKHVPGLFLFLFLKPTHWNHLKTVSKSYQNRIKIVSKSYQKRVKTVSKSYQNRIKTISKSYQNQNDKPLKKRPRKLSLVPGLFLFLFLKPTHWNHIKTIQNRIKIISKSQNRTKTVSKSYQNHIKTTAKSYQNHKNPGEIDQKAVPGLFQFPFLPLISDIAYLVHVLFKQII